METIEDEIRMANRALIDALTDNSEENLAKFIALSNNLYKNHFPDFNYDLYPNEIAALISNEYKESPYKIGDRIHIYESNGIHDWGNGPEEETFFEADCTLSSVALVYTLEFKPVLAYVVTFDDGRVRKIRGIESIKYKIAK